MQFPLEKVVNFEHIKGSFKRQFQSFVNPIIIIVGLKNTVCLKNVFEIENVNRHKKSLSRPSLFICFIAKLPPPEAPQSLIARPLPFFFLLPILSRISLAVRGRSKPPPPLVPAWLVGLGVLRGDPLERLFGA